MEDWRRAWREGIVPQLSTGMLVALREGLLSDDPRLGQGYTTSPPPMGCTAEWPVESACALGYMAAAELGGFAYDYNPDGTVVLPAREGAATVAEVEEAFGRLCSECDRLLGEKAGCRHFLNAYDEWTHAELAANLLPEVELALFARDEPLPEERP